MALVVGPAGRAVLVDTSTVLINIALVSASSQTHGETRSQQIKCYVCTQQQA